MKWNLAEAVAYYRNQGAPGDQSAVIALLRELQQENGGAMPRKLLAEAAELLGTKEALFLALVKRIPSLRLSDTTARNGQIWQALWRGPTEKTENSPSKLCPVCACAAKAPISNGTGSCIIRQTRP